ncbi:hypothetical protein [Clostridium hydrogenum]|nr:hypothetical protein [Clostridium hydrogenum]
MQLVNLNKLYPQKYGVLDSSLLKDKYKFIIVFCTIINTAINIYSLFK